MKKILVFTLLTAVLLAGCSQSGKTDTSADSPTNSPASGETAQASSSQQAASSSSAGEGETGSGGSIQVDKGPLSAEITLPASFFAGGQDSDQIIAEAKNNGVSEVTKNADGSYTYKMSKSVYKKMLEETEKNVLDYLDSLKNGEDFKSIKDVKHNKDFSDFTLSVDQSSYQSSLDGFAGTGIGLIASMYQSIAGVAQDKLKVTIHVQDAATGKEFDTLVYPQDMK